MPHSKWSDALALGLPAMDDTHEEFFQMLELEERQAMLPREEYAQYSIVHHPPQRPLFHRC